MDFVDGSDGSVKSLSFNQFGWREAAESNEKHGVVCESEIGSRMGYIIYKQLIKSIAEKMYKDDTN